MVQSFSLLIEIIKLCSNAFWKGYYTLIFEANSFATLDVSMDWNIPVASSLNKILECQFFKGSFFELGGRDERVWHRGMTFLRISYILISYCYQIMNALVSICGSLTCFSFNDSNILYWVVPIFCSPYYSRLAISFLVIKRNKEWPLWQMVE